jgi:hypothetical protein
MSDTPDGRPRPTPRPRPGAAPRPTPRPRVAGSRREREEADAAATPRPAPGTKGTAAAVAGRSATARPERSRATASAAPTATADRRRLPALLLVLTLLCVLAAAGVGVLLWQRLNPTSVDASVFSATRSGVQAIYAYDYRDSEGSVQGKLDVLTGDLHDQYEKDLSQGGIIDTYEQVSATTSYEVLDVGLQQINEAQDTATLVVFGEYVVESVNTGDQPAPEGSGCRTTPEGGQSCTQTVDVGVVKVDGDWKINELTLRTTS